MCCSMLVCVHVYNLWCGLFFFYLPTGLNGRPICMVRDDWNVTTSLFPHPLLKSHTLRETARLPFSFPLASNLYGLSNANNQKSSTCVKTSMFDFVKSLPLKSFWVSLWTEVIFLSFFFFFLNFTAAFSEAWREALKELAANVHMAAQEQKDQKEVQFLQQSTLRVWESESLRISQSQPSILFSLNCIT